MNKRYITNLTIEVTVDTQFGPQDAINLVSNSLQYPAILSAYVTTVTSNYAALSPTDSQMECFNKLPICIKKQFS